MTNPQRIDLSPHSGRHDEAVAVAAISPGHLIMFDSAGKVKKHNLYGGRTPIMFAKGDHLQGKTIDDAYAADDQAQILIPAPGDNVYAKLPAGAAAVVIGDVLISNGDGTLVKATSVTAHTLYASAAASTAVTNTVSTEQFFSQTYTVAANTLQVGDILRIRGHAIVSAAAGTDTLTFKLYIGGVTIYTSAAINSTTGDEVVFDAHVVVRVIGASGKIVANIVQSHGVPATATALPLSLAETTLDTTAAAIIRASATWSATTATCTVALQSLTIERIAPGSASLLAQAREAVDNSAEIVEAFLRVRVF